MSHPRPLRRRSLLTLFAGLLLIPARAEDDRPIVDDKRLPPEAAATASLPTLWIAGDSTVRSNSPMRGWGQDLGSFFDPSKINVVNRAIGGRSARTFFTEGKWQAIANAIKPGDFVIIQFGHNDVGALDEKGKFRGSIRGTGPETRTITKPDGTTEQVHSYGWYLTEMTRSAIAKKASVILCSPIPHKKFDRRDQWVPDWADFRQYVATVATAEHAAFLDLSHQIGIAYAKLDKPAIEALFADQGTHTNAAGSLLNARTVLAGLRALPAAPFDSFLSPAGREIAPLLPQAPPPSGSR